MVYQLKDLPIIIGGFYRSGTSLLRRIIDSHSNIHCGPEVKFFKDFYGDYIYDELRHVRLFKTLKSLGLNEKELLNLFGKAFIDSHKLAAKKLNKKRWADKNPENVIYLKQWCELLPEGFIFVYVTRHPLDTLASLKEAGFSKAVPTEFHEKVNLYKNYNENAMAHIEKFTEKCIIVNYEKLVTNPAETISVFLEKIGEKFEPDMLSNFNSNERQDGIEDPKIKNSKEIHTRSIGSWKYKLTKEEAQYASKIIGIKYLL